MALSFGLVGHYPTQKETKQGRISMRGFLQAVMLLAVSLSFSLQGASAQEWPLRPISMVIPFAAGGGVDTGGRVLAPRLSELLGQQIVVENIGGAGGMAGAARVAKAPRDGYQILLGHTGTHAYNPHLYKRPLYDVRKDFDPVTLVYRTSFALLVRKDFPAKTIAEFVTHLRANQRKLQYGSAGVGSTSHMSCVLLNMTAQVDVAHIPYRDVAPALQDLIGGRIDYLCNPVSVSIAQVQTGVVKAIGLLSLEREPQLPQLPTAHEQGLTNLNTDSWSGFFFPRGTPPAVTKRMAAAVSQTLDTPAVQQRMIELGLRPTPPQERMPQYLEKLVLTDLEKWAAPIKASGIAID